MLMHDTIIKINHSFIHISFPPSLSTKAKDSALHLPSLVWCLGPMALPFMTAAHVLLGSMQRTGESGALRSTHVEDATSHALCIEVESHASIRDGMAA